MPDMQGDLILAQNSFVYIQDETKGTVQVVCGPFKTGMTGNDKPVVYDSRTGCFNQIRSLNEAIQQNIRAREGFYIVLENPAEDDKKEHPFDKGGNIPTELAYGRKINIPGPAMFALWPGQVATVIEGHQLRSNEYVIARIYNVEEAKTNWKLEKVTLPEALVVGQLIVIKGTEVNFFIPPTGVEVVPENGGHYIRKAVTLERLEYAILLSESGDKRYERGPKVVFPEATEIFIQKRDEDGNRTGNVKFKAIELNDQMGLYIKVIADYEEEGKNYKVGEELFITGKEQRIYYPRPEHAIIEYGGQERNNDGKKFSRQRYYGIAIPDGEGRYVLDKRTGKIEKVAGPQIFLPDPRYQTIVRRILDDKTLELWYPGNQDAKQYNKYLREMVNPSENYVDDINFRSSVMDLNRSINRMTSGSAPASAAVMAYASSPTRVEGDVVKRGTKYTPPPSLTLNTKFDGVPTIDVWTGYAVQVVDKTGHRRVEIGPTTILLDYDEKLEAMELSTNNPKSTDNLLRQVYLRVSHNKISDTITVETKDLVRVNVKVSYRVNFEGEKEKWFGVENYVKFLCDHMRSLVRAKVKHYEIKEFIQKASEIARDTVLGEHQDGGERPGRQFKENGMNVYDLEVLGVEIQDKPIASLLINAQQKAVEQVIQIDDAERTRELTVKKSQIEREINKVNHELIMFKLDNDAKEKGRRAEIVLQELDSVIELEKNKLTAKLEQEHLTTEAFQEELERTKLENAEDLQVNEKNTELFVKRWEVVGPKLLEAINSVGDKRVLEDLAKAVAPLALVEQGSFSSDIKRLFENTPLSQVVDKLLTNGKLS